MRQIVAKLLLAAVSSALCLGAAEIALRVVAWQEDGAGFAEVFRAELPALPSGREAKLAHLIHPSPHPKIIYELRPNLQVRFAYGSHVTTDARGFRSHGDVSAPGGDDDDDAFRIVGLGDSFMFGQGVSDGQAYLSILARELAADLSGPPVVVLNTAVPGYNTSMEVATLEERALDPPPDLVLVHFVGNDLTLPNFIREPRPLSSIRRSFLAEFIAARLTASREASPEDEGATALGMLRGVGLVPAPRGADDRFEREAARVPEAYRLMVGWQGYERALDHLAALGDRYGFEVVVLSSAVTPYQRALSSARERDFHALDVGPSIVRYLEVHGYERYRGSPLALSENDGHPSALGHALIAEVLLDFLRSEGLVGDAAEPS